MLRRTEGEVVRYSGRVMNSVVVRVAILVALFAVACAPSAPAPAAKPTEAPAKPAAAPAKPAEAAKPAEPAKPAEAPKPAAAAPAAKAKVDRLVVAIVTPGTEGNAPGRDLGAPDTIQLRPMYEKLIGVDPKTGAFVPQLATEWKLEPDGKSYRFMLRKGVQFHKGHGELTAKDVAWSWEDITVQDSQASNSLYFRNVVEKVEVVNDHEVVFHLKTPEAEFLTNISEMVGGMEIQSKAHFDKVGKPPTLQDEPIAGTGPYQFKERVQSQYIRYERVPFQHWRLTPDFPELELRWQNEASTRMAALLAGEVHVTPLPTDLQKQVLAQSQFKLLKSTAAGLRVFMPFLCCYHNDINDRSKGEKYPESPLMNVNVRRAINQAVNRDELNKAFFAGKGELMYMNNLHPTLPGWNPDWEKKFQEAWGYNPEKARSLLAEAGYGPSKPVKTQLIPLRLTDVPESPDVVEAIAGYLRAVGIEVEMVTVDVGTHNTKRRNLGYDNAIDIRSTASHPLTGWRVYNSSRHGIRGSGVEIFELDDLYRKVQTTMDDAQSAALWKQMGDISFDQYQQINLFWLPTEVVVNTSFVGDYVFPGNISGSWTHLDGIKAAN
jgi:peptide/nickel transport system substrate-binding protein